MSNQQQVIVFDVAGVLYHVNFAVGEYLEKKYKISESQQDYLWTELHPLALVGKLSLQEFIDEFANYYKLDRKDVDESDFSKPFEETIVPVAGMAQLLSELSTKGYTLAVLSDTAEVFDKIRKENGFYKYFDKIFLSYKTGFRKPDRNAYKVVLDSYSLEPADFIFIDDREENVNSAIEFGMKGIVFTNVDSLRRKLFEFGIE